VRAILWHLRLHRLAYWVEPDYRTARRVLRRRTFDVVIANDLTAAGVAAAIAPKERILLDLHEYWLGLQDDIVSWRKLRAPYYAWLLRKYASGMASYTTVSGSIAERYHAEFGIDCRVVTNSSVYRDFFPQPVDRPLRLVHSGVAKPARRIETMMRAVAATKTDVVFDLYLTGVTGDYYKHLQAVAEELGERVRLVPPVPHSQLLEVLNKYDVGVPFLPPTTTNIRLCLPNKFFDYVQARLAILTGPTEAMSELVEKHSLGVVTENFEQQALTREIDELSVESVRKYKQNVAVAAQELAGERQIAVWRSEVERIVDASQTGGL
jgi:hypothetical protein